MVLVFYAGVAGLAEPGMKIVVEFPGVGDPG
jgi:hypothetical protein